MVYLVTWDLNRENMTRYKEKRSALISRLEALDSIRDPDLDSVYFVSSSDPARTIYDDLTRNLVDGSDRLMVAEFNRWWALINPAVAQWIKDHH